jgi:hypothetical protein
MRRILGFVTALWLAGPAASATTLTITANPNPAPAGVEVTFTFAPSVSHADDSVTLDFGDQTTATVTFSVGCQLFGGCSTAKHTFAGAGVLTVTGTGTIGGAAVSGSMQLTVTSTTPDDELFVGTSAHAPGYNKAFFRTDLWVHNPGETIAYFSVAALLRDTANNPPVNQVTLGLGSGQTVVYKDALASLFSLPSPAAAALRITQNQGRVVVTSRTYTSPASGGTYGQFVPAIARAQAVSSGHRARLIGLSHDPSLVAGFRTNLGLVNLSPAGITVQVEFYDVTGGLLRTRSYTVDAFGYVQIDRVFEDATSLVVNNGLIVVSTPTTGARFLAYASVIDNISQAPLYVPAVITD